MDPNDPNYRADPNDPSYRADPNDPNRVNPGNPGDLGNRNPADPRNLNTGNRGDLNPGDRGNPGDTRNLNTGDTRNLNTGDPRNLNTGDPRNQGDPRNITPRDPGAPGDTRNLNPSNPGTPGNLNPDYRSGPPLTGTRLEPELAGTSQSSTMIKTITFNGRAGNGAVGDVPIATVTGNVLIQRIDVAVSRPLVGVNARLSLGTMKTPGLFFPVGAAGELLDKFTWDGREPGSGSNQPSRTPAESYAAHKADLPSGTTDAQAAASFARCLPSPKDPVQPPALRPAQMQAQMDNRARLPNQGNVGQGQGAPYNSNLHTEGNVGQQPTSVNHNLPNQGSVGRGLDSSDNRNLSNQGNLVGQDASYNRNSPNQGNVGLGQDASYNRNSPNQGNVGLGQDASYNPNQGNMGQQDRLGNMAAGEDGLFGRAVDSPIVCTVSGADITNGEIRVDIVWMAGRGGGTVS